MAKLKLVQGSNATVKQLREMFFTHLPHTDIQETFINNYFGRVNDLYFPELNEKALEDFDKEQHINFRKYLDKRWQQFKKFSLTELLMSYDYLLKKRLYVIDDIIITSPVVLEMIEGNVPKDMELLQYVRNQNLEFYRTTNSIFYLHERIDYVFQNGVKSGQNIPDMKNVPNLSIVAKEISGAFETYKEIHDSVSREKQWRIDVAAYLQPRYPKKSIHWHNLHLLSEEQKRVGREYLRSIHGSGPNTTNLLKDVFRNRRAKGQDREK